MAIAVHSNALAMVRCRSATLGAINRSCRCLGQLSRRGRRSYSLVLLNYGYTYPCQRVLTCLLDWLSAPEQSELRRAFNVWLRQVLLPSRLPGVEIPQVIDLAEMKAMLAERVQEWTKKWKQAGIEEGLQRGRTEGLQEGQVEFLIMLLECKFGSLVPEYRQRILGAGQDDLRRWGTRVLVAQTLDEVFN